MSWLPFMLLGLIHADMVALPWMSTFDAAGTST
jgi:hypothetical protein